MKILESKFVKGFIKMADALQDMYICLKMDEALEHPVTVVETQTQPWAQK